MEYFLFRESVLKWMDAFFFFLNLLPQLFLSIIYLSCAVNLITTQQRLQQTIYTHDLG